MKKKRRSPSAAKGKPTPPPSPPRVDPTPEQQARPGMEEHNGIWYNRQQVALDYYHNKKPGGITLPQYEAGCLLYEAFTMSGIFALATPGYWYLGQELGVRVDGSKGKGDRNSIHYDTAVNAMLAVSGQIGRKMIEGVCCYGYYLKDIDVPGYDKGEHKMKRFREALDELVEHFRVHIPEELREHYNRRWRQQHEQARSHRRSRKRNDKPQDRVRRSSHRDHGQAKDSHHRGDVPPQLGRSTQEPAQDRPQGRQDKP